MTTVVRPELVARIRLVTRLLAFGDPRASSDLPPFVRARRFIEHVCTLNRDEWNDVLRRERGESDHRDLAEQMLRDAPLLPTEFIACAAIASAARRAVRRASANELLPRESIPRAARLVANASVAIVLRDLLPESVFRTLYGAFVRQ